MRYKGLKTLRGTSNSFIQGVTLPTGQPAVIADFNLRPSPLIKALRDEILPASYSIQERAQLSFCSGSFSPGLRYLAIRTTGIVSGDPEQVWRYELAKGQLVPVIPTPTVTTSPEILSIHWAGEALHVIGIDRSNGRQFEAELYGQGSPSITYTQRSSPSPQAEDPLGSAGRYPLTPTVLHGGSTSWTAQREGRGPKKVIAAALLNAPVVDAAIPFFFYVPVSYSSMFREDAVAALNLATGRQATQRLRASDLISNSWLLHRAIAAFFWLIR